MQSGLRVLIDARKLLHGGIGTYTQNLIAGLLEQEVSVRPALTLVGRESEIVKMPWGREVDVIEEHSSSYSLDELLFLGRRLQKQVEQRGLQVFHAPHYTLPLGVQLPTIMTVHDLIHIRHPEKRYYPFIARRLMRAGFERSSRVVAVSRSTAKDLQEEFSDVLSLKKNLVVVPNAVDPAFLIPQSTHREVRKKFSLSGEFLFCIFSMLKPHKGWQDLLLAYAEVLKQFQGLGRQAPTLVLAGIGTEGSKNEKCIRDIFPDQRHLRILGALDKEDIVGLLAEAQALVVPSLAEGFSLPVLEAQSLGTPVLARPVPAIGELLTDNDYQARDMSLHALTEMLTAFMTEDLESPALRAGEQEQSQERILSYERRTVARILLNMYNEILLTNTQGTSGEQRRSAR